MDNDNKFPFYYKTLGLKATCNEKEIIEAFQDIQKKHKKNSSAFIIAQTAKTVLLDPVKRYRYNTNVNNDINFGAVHDHTILTKKTKTNPLVSSFLSAYLPNQSNDLCENLNVTLQELYSGATKQVTLKQKRLVACKVCFKNVSMVPCPKCTVNNSNLPEVIKNCQVCRGKGMIIPICKNCNGEKVTRQEVEKLTVHIAKGMVHNQKISIPQKGHNLYSVSVAGKVVLTLKQTPHKDFYRCGDDLWMRKKINITEALCGNRLKITHLDGRMLLCNSSPVNSDAQKIIKGKGMPVYKNTLSEFGDLVIVFQVQFPDRLNVDNLPQIRQCLPKRPKLTEKDELEECTLTKYDPTAKPNKFFNMHQAYYEDKNIDLSTLPLKDTRCAQQ